MPLKSRGSVSARLRVWFSLRSAAANCVERRLHGLDAAAVERAHARPRPRSRQSEARFFGARLGQDERPGREVEGGEPDLPGHRRAARPPAQAAGDHEMEHEEQVVLEDEHQPLALPAERASPAFPVASRSGGSAVRSTNGAAHADPLQRLAERRAVERLEVDGDVGILRHGDTLTRKAPAGPASPARRAARSRRFDGTGRRGLDDRGRELGQVLRDSARACRQGDPPAGCGRVPERGSPRIRSGCSLRGRSPTARGRAVDVERTGPEVVRLAAEQRQDLGRSTAVDRSPHLQLHETRPSGDPARKP